MNFDNKYLNPITRVAAGDFSFISVAIVFCTIEILKET